MSLEDFIKEEYDKNVCLSSSVSLYDATTGEFLYSDQKIVIVPKIVSTENRLAASKLDYKIYKIEYKAKDFQRERELIVYDEEDKIINKYEFSDLSKDKAEKARFAKKMREITHQEQPYYRHVHDKKITNEQPLKLPSSITLWQDTGFIGHKPENVTVKMPTKKPKGKQLSDTQKKENEGICCRVFHFYLQNETVPSFFRIIVTSISFLSNST